MLNAIRSEPSLARFLADPRAAADPARSDEDRDVWTSLLKLLQQTWRTHERSLYDDFVSGLDLLEISPSRIPSLSDINRMLSGIGWSAAYVDGMVADRLYQEMQAARVFPVSRHIRRKRDLFHSAAPDFVHDVLGHLPMLFSPHYQSLLSEWARRALLAHPDQNDIETSGVQALLIAEREKAAPDQERIAELTDALGQLHHQMAASPSRAACFARFYAWAIEFGVTGDGSDIKIGGSAALSSPGEFDRIISGRTRLLPFAERAIASAVNYSVVQDTIFVARDFDEYGQVLARI